MRVVCLNMRLFSLGLIVFMAASGQQTPAPLPPQPVNAPGSNAQPGGAVVTFSSTLNLVTEDVTVMDKNGKPVDNLTKDDFTVTEDGVPQTISFLQYQNLPDDTGPGLQTRPDTPQIVTPLDKLTRTEIAAEPPGDVQDRDRRLLVLYFDMTSMPQGDQLRALSAAEKFIRSQMAKEDLAAIMKYDGASVQVLSDFTDDRDKLQSIIETIIVGEGQGFDETSDDAASSDTGAAFGQDDSEFNIFTTDRQLAALQTAAKMLGKLNEKKVMVVFASGISLNGVDNQAQLHATENAALRANVSFWPVDARGLVAMAPLGDASMRTAGAANLSNGAASSAFSNRLQQTQDTLWTLASDTGGNALLDNNDLGRGILNAERSIGSYYILGYNTTNAKQDGKFRRIKITLKNGLVASNYRQGYYGEKVYGKFTAADKERQLEDALMVEDPLTEITIAMELDFFELNRAEYFVPMIVKIPGRELALARKGGAELTQIDFVYEIKDEFGTTVTNLRDKAGPIKLSGATAAELAKRPIEYDTGFTLLPGGYTIKFLARDAETGRIGTYQTKFTIPNLMKEVKRVPISSVVLSSQRVDLKDALFNALKDKDRAETANPLVVDGQKLIPSVTRVFSKSKEMYVFLQAYEPAAETVRPVVAFVTLYKGQTKAFETTPIQVATPSNLRLKTLPLRFTVPLDSLQLGEYNCQVTVLDPDGQKASFWEAPIMLVP